MRRSTSTPARCSHTTIPPSRTMGTSPPSKVTNMDQLTFLSEEPPANPSLSQDSVADWMTTVATWPLSFAALLGECSPAGSSGRMSLASFPWTKGQPSVPSLERWRNLGMAWRGECLTLNTSEWNHTLAPSRSDGSVCSLSDILETGDHLSRYCLSPKACAGILRRAEKRGRALPPLLHNGVGTCGADDNQAQGGHLVADTVRSHPRPGSNSCGNIIGRSTPWSADRPTRGGRAPYGPAGYRLYRRHRFPTAGSRWPTGRATGCSGMG